MKTSQTPRFTTLLIGLGLAIIGALLIGQVYSSLDQSLLQFLGSTAIILIAALLTARLTRRPASPGLRPKEVAVEHDPVRETGKIKWFNVDKGFGFIIRDNGEDLFVHFRAVNDGGASRLIEGQRVEYQIGQGRKGPQAEEVITLD